MGRGGAVRARAAEARVHGAPRGRCVLAPYSVCVRRRTRASNGLCARRHTRASNGLCVRHRTRVSNGLCVRHRTHVSNGLCVRRRTHASNGLRARRRALVSNGLRGRHRTLVSNGLCARCVGPKGRRWPRVIEHPRFVFRDLQHCVHVPETQHRKGKDEGRWEKKARQEKSTTRT